MNKLILNTALLLLFSSPALAAPYTYAPDQCEFEITFPEKPFIEQKCAGSINDCAEVVSYTKTSADNSSLTFRVTCNTLSEKDAKNYTPEIIQTTLEKMIKDGDMVPYAIQSDDKGKYKSASAICLTRRNETPVIYNGQIWIGHSSMFTIEAEMSGGQDEIIEKSFAEILKSAHMKSATAEAPIAKADEKKTGTKKGD